MSAMASLTIDVTIVYSTVWLGADQRKHQRSPLLAFVRGIHRWPVNSPHKGPVTRKMLPFDDVIMSITDGCKTDPPVGEADIASHLKQSFDIDVIKFHENGLERETHLA